MNIRKLGSVVLLTVVLFSTGLFVSPAFAATDYFVSNAGSDTNAGTQASPFATIQKASTVAQSGSTVHVAPGNYAGGIVTSANGTATARIRYVSDTKWGAKINLSATGTDGAAWENRGSYVDIDGFDIDGTNMSALYIGIYNVGSNTVIKNNIVHNFSNSTCVSHGAGGIVTDHYNGGVLDDVISNIVHDIGPATACNLDHGIYVQTSGVVENNITYHNSGWGITTWHDATNMTIENNTVFNNLSGGISFGSGGYYTLSAAQVDNFIVNNNIAYQNPYGIVAYGDVGTHSSVSNNLVYGNTTNWSLNTVPTDPAPVTADPQFVQYKALGGGDYHLSSSSPAIDKGTSVLAPTSDMDGISRPQGAGYDIGAYEFKVAVAGAVTITSPVNGATATNPVTVGASVDSTTCNNGFNHMQVLVNGVQMYVDTSGSCAISVPITMPVGSDTIQVQAIRYDGIVMAQSSVTITAQAPSDTQSPTVPANLSATTISQTQINLTWSASTDNVGVVGYAVFRNGTQITTTSNTSYSDTSLVANTSYSYTVAAYDAAGNVSAESAAANATTLSAVSGPVGYWKFNETTGTVASDASNNNHPGTLKNVKWVAGKFGNGVSFNGSSSSINYGNNFDLTGSDLSFSIWVKPATLKDYMAFIDKLSSGGNYRLIGYANGVVEYGIRNTANGYDYIDSAAGALKTGVWTHIVVVHNYSTNTATLYINGVSAGSRSFAIARGATTQTLGNGYTANNGVYFKGALDEMRIYNRSLSASEVQSLYNNTLADAAATPSLATSNGVAPNLTQPLVPGMQAPAVITLQKILNQDSSTMVASVGIGAPGQETDYFGQMTMKAVQKFQEKWGIVTAGSPATSGFGSVGPKTLQKLREIMGL